MNIDKLSESLRKKILNLNKKEVFISSLLDSQQSKDLKKKPNCEGFGRIRHFKMIHDKKWIKDPLPILPANKCLGTDFYEEIKAQVFQIGACNFRCWYCFVDNKLLCGNKKFGALLTSEKLIDLYLSESEKAPVIDLSGGQPDLVPEWTIWMMEELEKRGINNDVLLWSDDNLSNDYFWKYLSDSQISYFSNYKNYAKVGCIKGIDKESFSINTSSPSSKYDLQFDLFKRFYDLGIDLYGYITLTASTKTDFAKAISELFSRLQKIHENLPLRIIPLKIVNYTPMSIRRKKYQEDLIEGQNIAMEYWHSELSKRYNSEMIKKNIAEIKIN